MSTGHPNSAEALDEDDRLLGTAALDSGHLRWARMDRSPGAYHLSYDGRISLCGVPCREEWLSLRSVRVSAIARCPICQRVVSAQLGLTKAALR